MTEPGGGWASPSDGAAPPPPAWSSPAAPLPGPPPPAYAGVAPTWMPAPGVVPLRPLGLGELLDGALKIIRRNPRPTLGFSAVIATILTLTQVLVLVVQGVPDVDLTTGRTSSSQFSNPFSTSNLVQYLLGSLFGILLTGVLVSVVSRAVLGQQTSFSEAWQTVRSRLGALFGLSLLSTLILFAPAIITTLLFLAVGPVSLVLLLVDIPAMIYLWVRLSMTSQVLLLEKAGAVVALRRSATLAHRDFWRILGVRLLTLLIVRVLTSILVIIPTVILTVLLFVNQHFSLWALIAVQVCGGLASVVTAPYSSGVISLLYVDERMRTEGLDVALQTAASSGAGRS